MRCRTHFDQAAGNTSPKPPLDFIQVLAENANQEAIDDEGCGGVGYGDKKIQIVNVRAHLSQYAAVWFVRSRSSDQDC